MNKTLVKSKIVLENNGTGLTIYFWKKTWWIFGYWYCFGNSSSLDKISEEKLNRISDSEISKILVNKFLYGFR